MIRGTFKLTAVLMLGLALAGCGKKGAPEAPKDQANTYPRAYPYDPTKPSKTDAPSFPGFGDTNNDPTQIRSPE